MFDLNLLRAPDILLFADAIRAMVFRVHRNKTMLLFEFDGQIKFKLDEVKKILFMYDTTQREIIEVFRFSRWSIQHWMLFRRIMQAMKFYEQATHKVKLHNYRAMLGGLMEELIVNLAKLMEAAETEAAEIAKLDRTKGGTSYHPDIRRILQMDGPESEQS